MIHVPKLAYHVYGLKKTYLEELILVFIPILKLSFSKKNMTVSYVVTVNFSLVGLFVLCGYLPLKIWVMEMLILETSGEYRPATAPAATRHTMCWVERK